MTDEPKLFHTECVMLTCCRSIQCILTNPNSSVPKLRKVQTGEFVQISEPLNIMQGLVNYSNRTGGFRHPELMLIIIRFPFHHYFMEQFASGV